MNSIRHTARAAALALTLLWAHALPAPAAAGETYRVYCVNGKVDFGTRPLQDMKWDFGENVCLLAEFNDYQSAKEDARRRGGVGAACACK